MSDLTFDAETVSAPAVKQSRSLARVSNRIGSSGLVWVLPLLVLIGAGFNLPLLLTGGWSFLDQTTGRLSLANYRDFATSNIYFAVIMRTGRVALTVSLICALVGYPLAYWMTRLSRRGQMLALGIIVTSFWVSILVRTYAWIVVLGNAGIVNRTLQSLGLTSKPVPFLYNELGVTIGMVNVLLPFMLLPLYAAMLQIDPRLRPMAYTLGASSGQFFRRVFFPLTLPALAATFVLVFILSLGFYITPAILGGGKVPLVANMLDILINQFPRWNLAAAISIVLLILTLSLYAVYQVLRRKT